jgi:hypothetical protein
MRALLRRFSCLHLFLYPIMLVRLHLISSDWGGHKGQQLAILYHIGFVEHTAPISSLQILFLVDGKYQITKHK